MEAQGSQKEEKVEEEQKTTLDHLEFLIFFSGLNVYPQLSTLSDPPKL